MEACGDAFDNDCDGTTAGACALNGELGTDSANATVTFGSSDYVLLGDPGDIVGDGREDVFVCGPTDGWVITEPGAGQRAAGSASDIHVDRAYSTGFGGGDGDGDGLGDLLVADRTSNGGPIYMLSLAGAGVELAASDGVELAEVEYLGSVEYGWVGDVTGDGFDDVGVAYTPDGYAEPAVEVYAGPFAGVTHGASVRLGGTETEPTSAKTMIAGGDLNGDGVSDLLISETWIDDFSGQVYAVLGPIESGAVEDADARWARDQSYLFGLRLATGEVDGDGYDDAIVGSMSNTDQAGTFIYAGPTCVEAASILAWDGYGASKSAVGDLNADGRDDLAIREYPGTADGQAVHVAFAPFSGALAVEDVAVATLVPDYTSACAGFGANLVMADGNADGNADLWIADGCGVPEHAAFMFLGGAD